MISLILKDFLVQKKSFIFVLVYSFFMIFMFRMPPFSEVIYIMGSMAIVYILGVGANSYDFKNNAEIIFNSLPVPKRNIVMAKYVGVWIFAAIGLVIMGFVGAMVKGGGSPIPIRFINSIDIIATFVTMVIINSLYYPFYFKFGYNFTRVANIILFLLIFFLPSNLIRYVKTNDNSLLIQSLLGLIKNTPGWMIGGGAVAVALAVMLVSLLISIKIYENKEF